MYLPIHNSHASIIYLIIFNHLNNRCSYVLYDVIEWVAPMQNFAVKCYAHLVSFAVWLWSIFGMLLKETIVTLHLNVEHIPPIFPGLTSIFIF